MKGRSRFLKGFLFLVLAGLMIGTATLPLSAQVSIPQGSTITSAVFSVYWYSYWPTTFNLQRIITDWNEATVTWNTFNSSYDSFIWGSFTTTAGGTGWYSADITGLVQAWVDSPASNFGIVLREIYPGVERWNSFLSSEYANVTLRPKLDIYFTTASGAPGHVVIQRPGEFPTDVFDATVFEIYPNTNYNSETLYVAHVPSDTKVYEKYSLIRFAFTVIPQQEGCTPGYWRNHYEDWPATGYQLTDTFNTVFGVNYFAPNYTLQQAIWQGGGGKSLIARHGTAALLSAAHPDVNYPYTVAEVIAFVQSGDVSKLVAANELGCFIK